MATRDRRHESLGLVGHEEMQLVLDDRSAECDAVFLALRFGLSPGGEFGRRLRAEVVRRVGAERFALELIGARAA